MKLENIDFNLNILRRFFVLIFIKSSIFCQFAMKFLFIFNVKSDVSFYLCMYLANPPPECYTVAVQSHAQQGFCKGAFESLGKR